MQKTNGSLSGTSSYDQNEFVFMLMIKEQLPVHLSSEFQFSAKDHWIAFAISAQDQYISVHCLGSIRCSPAHLSTIKISLFSCLGSVNSSCHFCLGSKYHYTLYKLNEPRSQHVCLWSTYYCLPTVDESLSVLLTMIKISLLSAQDRSVDPRNISLLCLGSMDSSRYVCLQSKYVGFQTTINGSLPALLPTVRISLFSA